MDGYAGGWMARTRITSLMFAAGALLVGLSVVPSQPAAVARPGILAVAAAAAAAAIAPLGLGRRFTAAVSHAFGVAGSVMVAAAVLLAGGGALSLLYGVLFVWVAKYAAVVFGWRPALAHAAVGATLHATVLAVLDPGYGMFGWVTITATSGVVVASHRLSDRFSAQLRALVERSGGVITVVDERLTITAQRGPLDRMLGRESWAVEGEPLTALVHPDDRRRVAGVLERVLAEPGATATTGARLIRGDGSVVHAELAVRCARDVPALDGMVVTIRDVSEQRRLEDELAHQALHDGLTGLPNRALFLDRVEHALGRHRPGNTAVAVLLVDLDDFSSVNDSLGHPAGDELIGILADRMTRIVAAADTVARLGGDEFAVLVEDVVDEQPIEQLAWRAVGELGEPVTLDGGHEVFVGASVGAALSTPETGCAEELLRDADVAMYRAKQDGKGRYQRFVPAMHRTLLRRLRLRTDLRRALERDELEIHYQPTVQLDTGRLDGLEALLRWHHPTLGAVGPDEFVPLAEETGLIVPLGRWVLRRACADTQAWQQRRPAGQPLAAHVNVSGRQLEDDGLVDDVRVALEASGLAPSGLVLEVTETALLEDLDTAAGRLEDLRRLGVGIAIDDFGTGYSSFSYLSRLPIDVIKIDKSFVDLVHTHPDGADVITSIVDVGRNLGLRCLAEGIEHPEQADLLARIGCEQGQGYHFGRPLPSEQLTGLLDRPDPTAPGAASAGTAGSRDPATPTGGAR